MPLTVIKVGGSLCKSEKLNELCIQLGSIGKRHSILIIPGGSIFADNVRVITEKNNIDQDTAHWMAILAMNQYGYLLSSLIPESVLVENIEEAKKYLNKLVPVVLLPYHLIKIIDPLPHSWDITSDSIAAWITGYIGAERLLLIKSMDMPNVSGEKNDYRIPVDIERLRGTNIVDPMFYAIMKEIKMRAEDNSLSTLRRLESKDQTGSWMHAFEGMAIKSHKAISGQLRETGLWIINGNCIEKLTGLFEYYKIG